MFLSKDEHLRTFKPNCDRNHSNYTKNVFLNMSKIFILHKSHPCFGPSSKISPTYGAMVPIRKSAHSTAIMGPFQKSAHPTAIMGPFLKISTPFCNHGPILIISTLYCNHGPTFETQYTLLQSWAHLENHCTLLQSWAHFENQPTLLCNHYYGLLLCFLAVQLSPQDLNQRNGIQPKLVLFHPPHARMFECSGF